MEHNKRKHVNSRICKKKFNKRDHTGSYRDLKTHQNVNRNIRTLVKSNIKKMVKKKDYDSVNYVVPSKVNKKSKTWWDCHDWTFRSKRQYGLKY